MHTHPHLIKQTLVPRLINEINKRTQSNSEKLSNSDKLTYINDNYCEITRNYTSFYGMNILSIVLFYLSLFYVLALFYSLYMTLYLTSNDT
ncbi:hypothetical protein MUTS15_71770 [Escherichia coli]|nr:hypothetical protein G799_03956 [Escherichia coli HVH 141 (4-5995973)]EQS30997.1 hypothetical protein G804_03995 [Escherichia coli HVH 146 (4-3189767)]BDY98520.1 hypothetical protein MUTS15_71770 [Escherichia coli]